MRALTVCDMTCLMYFGRYRWLKYFNAQKLINHFRGIYLWSLHTPSAADITFCLRVLTLKNGKNVMGTVLFNKTTRLNVPR